MSVAPRPGPLSTFLPHRNRLTGLRMSCRDSFQKLQRASRYAAEFGRNNPKTDDESPR
jgi:hypothetical protein